MADDDYVSRQPAPSIITSEMEDNTDITSLTERRGGRRDQEEESLPQVFLPRYRSRPVRATPEPLPPAHIKRIKRGAQS